MENITKKCPKCGRELALECFGKDKRSKDGLQSYCKECKKQHNKQYRAEHVEYFKQWYAEHAEAKKQYSKQWRDNNAEARKQYMKQYKAEHADAIKQYFKQYRATIEGYARQIRINNLQADRKYGRCGKDEDPLPTIEEYIHLLSQPDYYDGKQYHWTEMGLDRIDNSKPHTIDNVIPCSTKNNRQRGRKSFEEFCELIQKR